jgi:hypothetical protein
MRSKLVAIRADIATAVANAAAAAESAKAARKACDSFTHEQGKQEGRKGRSVTDLGPHRGSGSARQGPGHHPQLGSYKTGRTPVWIRVSGLLLRALVPAKQRKMRMGGRVVGTSGETGS